MGDKSGIAWTDATWNPVVGCSRVSAGCDNCYAIRDAHRLGGNPNEKIGPVYAGLTRLKVLQSGQGAVPDWTGAVRCLPGRLHIPWSWQRPRRVFVNSMSDLFHPAVPEDFIDRVFAVMVNTPRHTYQVLTKRPDAMRAYVSRPDRLERIKAVPGFEFGVRFTWPRRNLWLGTSVEDQAAAATRLVPLLRTPAAVRFLSCEPLLGPVWLGEPTGLHWVIIGGESGTHARPMDLEWVRDLLAQCRARGIAPFVKQLGSVWAREAGARDSHGGDLSEWPPDLRVREFPQAVPV